MPRIWEIEILKNEDGTFNLRCRDCQKVFAQNITHKAIFHGAPTHKCAMQILMPKVRQYGYRPQTAPN